MGWLAIGSLLNVWANDELGIVAALFPDTQVCENVEITTTVTNRYDELDEVVCELAPPLTNCSLGNGLISQVG